MKERFFGFPKLVQLSEKGKVVGDDITVESQWLDKFGLDTFYPVPNSFT